MTDPVYYQLQISVRTERGHIDDSSIDWIEQMRRRILEDSIGEDAVSSWIVYDTPYTILRPWINRPSHPAMPDEESLWLVGFRIRNDTCARFVYPARKRKA